jgi:hypothetical protein
MKYFKKYLVVFSLLFFSFNAYSQSLDLGIKGGINYASISDITSDSRLGLTGGAFVGARFNTFALQAEFLFSQQGGEFNEQDIETDYVLVPLILKLHMFRVLNLQVGPQFSYLINESDILESEQLGVSGAAGIGLSLGSSLSIDARYNFGFTDAFKGASGKNKFISLALGLSFL